MPNIEIAAVDDSRIDVYRDLKHSVSNARDTFIAEGEKLVQRLLRSTCRTESILCTPTMRERLGSVISPETTVYIATTPIISQLIGFQFHRGVLACGRRPDSRPLESLWQQHPDDSGGLIVLCPELRDPENLGTIIRTAAAFGSMGVIAGRSGTDPFSRRVLRTSMGTVLQLPIVQTDDWPSTLSALHGAGFESVAAVLDESAEALSTFLVQERTALLLGNEDAGLPDELLRECRRRVTMTMAAGVDSLNVAVAAGILMHHITRGCVR